MDYSKKTGRQKMKKIIITFGTFDLFHVGHKRILQRAARLGDELHVGVSSDAFNFAKKNIYPINSQEDRMEIVGAIKGVTAVFLEESMEAKVEYIDRVGAHVLVMGDDWKGKFDYLVGKATTLEQVIYLPRTEGISTTELENLIRLKPPRS